MKKIIKITPIEKFFSISWIPHIRCNYNCMYCPKSRHDDFSEVLSFETLRQYWEQIFEKTKHRQMPYKINFSGGEITINKNFIPFVKWLRSEYSDHVEKILITTNGSASLSYYTKLFDFISSICFSTHSEYTTDDFLAKIKTLNEYAKKNNKMFFLNIMQEYWATDQIKETVRFCKSHDVPYSISKIIYRLPGSRKWPIFTNNKTNEPRMDLQISKQLLYQSDQEIDPLVEIDDKYYNIQVQHADNSQELTYSSKLRFMDMHHFNGWDCHAGLDRIFVLPTGSVYSGECENDFLGSLSDNTFKLFDTPHPCKRKTCTNNPDDLQTIKYANN